MLRCPTVLLLATAACAHSHGHEAAHRFDDAEKWALEFEAPARDAWQMPDEVVAALALQPAAVVADIGAATGYFPVRLARAVPQGRVYGVDIEPAMIDYLRGRARREQLTNLDAVLGEPGDPKLPEPVDLVLLVNTYHHIDRRPAYFAKLPLKSGGRVAIVDFRKDAPFGPPQGMRMDAAQIRDEMQAAGFTLVAEHTFLPHQHFQLFAQQALGGTR